MDEEIRKLIEILSEEIREIKKLVIEVRQANQLAQQTADAAMIEAKAAMKRADASWELVIITRNQVLRPFWKKILGIN